MDEERQKPSRVEEVSATSRTGNNDPALEAQDAVVVDDVHTNQDSALWDVPLDAHGTSPSSPTSRLSRSSPVEFVTSPTDQHEWIVDEDDNAAYSPAADRGAAQAAIGFEGLYQADRSDVSDAEAERTPLKPAQMRQTTIWPFEDAPDAKPTPDQADAPSDSLYVDDQRTTAAANPSLKDGAQSQEAELAGRSWVFYLDVIAFVLTVIGLVLLPGWIHLHGYAMEAPATALINRDRRMNQSFFSIASFPSVDEVSLYVRRWQSMYLREIRQVGYVALTLQLWYGLRTYKAYVRRSGRLGSSLNVWRLQQIMPLPFLRLLRPKLRSGCERLEWKCSCGRQMYGDYSREDAGRHLALLKSLPECKVTSASRSKVCISSVATYSCLKAKSCSFSSL